MVVFVFKFHCSWFLKNYYPLVTLNMENTMITKVISELKAISKLAHFFQILNLYIFFRIWPQWDNVSEFGPPQNF